MRFGLIVAGLLVADVIRALRIGFLYLYDTLR